MKSHQARFSRAVVPCLIFEDEHLLVINKPAGWNTHAPSPYAGEGLYEWLRDREARWSNLAILHRLDKETSGLIVFGKTPLANRSLTRQFTDRVVSKKYLLLSDRSPARAEFVAKSNIARQGDRYRSVAQGEPAETRFVSRSALRIGSANRHPKGAFSVEAEPRTGRTHQIRVHAAEHGFPVLGDTLYGGAPYARVCLHSAEIRLRHPATGEALRFTAPVDFAANPALNLRSALIDPEETNAFRLIHGAADSWPGWYVDRLGDFLLAQSELIPGPHHLDSLQALAEQSSLPAGPPTGLYHKRLTRQTAGLTPQSGSPQLLQGPAAPESLVVRENGLSFELSFREGYSVGLFLDQRDNRRRLLTRHVAADFELLTPAGDGMDKSEVLNVFAYTCGFSVAAARAGARTTSLDLSRKYLEWGRRNFARNGIEPTRHDFIHGDAFDWMRRLAKKQRRFGLVLLDPPTFSRSKGHGAFRAEKDYARLLAVTLPLVKPAGVLLVSTNAAGWKPEAFLEELTVSATTAGRRIVQLHYAPQPPDFPITRLEPGYLKTVWVRLD